MVALVISLLLLCNMAEVPYSGLLLRGPKFCESVKIDPAEIFAIAKFASQSGVGSREL